MLEQQRPLLIAHRGGAVGEVENSAAAFERALELNVDMLEFDVRQTGDRQLVLAHNPVLHAAGRRWVVQDTPLGALREIAPTLLTLDEYLERFGRQLPFNLDLKTYGFEADVMETLGRHNLIDNALVSSGHTQSLRLLARINPAIQRGLSRGHAQSSSLTINPFAWLNRWHLAQALPLMLRLADATAAMLQYQLADPELVERLHRAGYRVFAWTIDNAAEAADLAATGVDGITSNVPQRIRWAIDQSSATPC